MKTLSKGKILIDEIICHMVLGVSHTSTKLSGDKQIFKMNVQKHPDLPQTLGIGT